MADRGPFHDIPLRKPTPQLSPTDTRGFDDSVIINSSAQEHMKSWANILSTCCSTGGLEHAS
jgi:hypothetical protein